MPEYRATLFFRDNNNGESTRQFSATFADDATASANMATMVTAFQNVTDAYLYKTELTKFEYVAGSANASSNVFERMSATVFLDSNKKANFQVPSPVESMFMAGTNILNPADTNWTTLMTQFGTGLWTISDGEHITSTVTGKRRMVSSGRTNLSD